MVVQCELSIQNIDAKKSLTMTSDLEFSNTDEIESSEKDNIRNLSIMKDKYKVGLMVLAETIGTALLVLFGCMGAIHWDGPPSMPTPQLNFGLTVMFIVHIFGHISYALINPAVTVAAVVCQLISWQVSLVSFSNFVNELRKANSILTFSTFYFQRNIDRVYFRRRTNDRCMHRIWFTHVADSTRHIHGSRWWNLRYIDKTWRLSHTRIFHRVFHHIFTCRNDMRMLEHLWRRISSTKNRLDRCHFVLCCCSIH